MANVRDEYIEMRGLRFHFRDWPAQKQGSGNLVLLHGYTGHARSWDAFAEAMSAKYRVLALDQRGHGESGWAAADAYGTDEMVKDLESFVSALGLARFALLGLSMGGLVSIGYAGKQPAELDRLVIVDIAPSLARSGLLKIQNNVTGTDVFDSVDDAFAQARRYNPVPPEAHHRQRVVDSLMRTEAGQWTYRYDRALRAGGPPRARMSEEEGWRRVASIDVPTLLVRGENSDILDREVADRMISTLPEGRLVEVAGSGHPVPLDKPEEFLAAVRGFL